MRIDFERTGGFAGMRVSLTVNTESLPPEEARALREMVEAARFFDLLTTIPSTAPGADQFQYKLLVEDEGRQHTIEVGEASAPPTLQPLLRRLTVMARSARPS
ncbi:MAG: protealysin inhibitor emfourin [Anaerolineales bacterium]